jgi:hypothetical protein
MSVEGAAPEYRGVFHVCVLLGDDPCREAVILFQTNRNGGPGYVYYDTEPRGADLAAYQFRAKAEPVTVPGLDVERYVYRVRLSGLEPGSTYHFVPGERLSGFAREFHFRTPPDTGALRFVEAGDLGRGLEGVDLLRLAAAQDPDFAVLGGDLAHCNGELDNHARWDEWFATWQRVMRAPDGRVIPLAVTVGNHEVNGRDSDDRRLRAPFFTTYFRDPDAPIYQARRFGDLAGILLLDSNHLTPHDGPQREFLERTLRDWGEVGARFAVYHKPFYPGHRDFHGDGATDGRTYWAPLFEQYGVAAAFEHHDHVLKRTVPLRAGEPHPDGVVYLGDGGLGQQPRPVHPDRWYLAHTAREAHFWLVDVTPSGIACRALGRGGRVLDEAPLAGVLVAGAAD